jgi:hypothetical protein
MLALSRDRRGLSAVSETRILKYTLEPDRRQLVMMPAEADPITVAKQNDMLVMWAEVPGVNWSVPRDYECRSAPRVFVVVTTGDRFHAEGKKYIGSAELGQWFVAHVYEQLPGYPDPIDTRVPEDWAKIKAEYATD